MNEVRNGKIKGSCCRRVFLLSIQAREIIKVTGQTVSSEMGGD